MKKSISYNILKFRRDNKFKLKKSNAEVIRSSAREVCTCAVIGRMIIGENFYVDED
jgi:hypothetical protein